MTDLCQMRQDSALVIYLKIYAIYMIAFYLSHYVLLLTFKTFNLPVQVQKYVSGGRNSVLVTGRKKILPDC